MNYLLFTTLVLIVVCSVMPIWADPIPESFCDSDKTFKTLLDEDFTNPTIDQSRWNIVTDDDRALYHFACGRSALCTRNNVWVENHQLHIRTKKQHAQSPISGREYEWTTGGIHSRDKFVIKPDEHTVTRICIRAALPMGTITQLEDGTIIDTGKGLWPAHWLMANNARAPVTQRNTQQQQQQNGLSFYQNQRAPLGTTSDDLIGSDVDDNDYHSCNPDEGEIDIMEHINSEPQLYATYHYQTDLDKTKCAFPKNHKSWSTTIQKTQQPLSKFHEYAVEKTANHISFWLDNVWVGTMDIHNNTDPKTQLDIPTNINATSPYFIYLNTALGGSWPGEPDDNTLNEFIHTIDYIKVTTAQRTPVTPTQLLQACGVIVAFFIVTGLIALIISKLCCSSGDNKDDGNNRKVAPQQSLQHSDKSPLLVKSRSHTLN